MPRRAVASSPLDREMRPQNTKNRNATVRHACETPADVRIAPPAARMHSHLAPSFAMSIGDPSVTSALALIGLLFDRFAGTGPAHDALGVVLHVCVAQLLGHLRALLVGGAILIGA